MAAKSTDSSPEGIRANIYKTARGNDVMDRLLNPSGDNKLLLPAPLPAVKLAAIYELSSVLRPNVDAYVANIEMRGHHFKPAIDFERAGARELVSEALFTEALVVADESGDDLSTAKEPTDKDVDSTIDKMQRQGRVELARAEAFFDSCFADGSFTDLRMLRRQDLESTGNAYWEVLRGDNGRPRNLRHAPSVTMRLGKAPSEATVKTQQRVTALSSNVVKVRRKFKKFAQVDGKEEVVAWFKEFGDPRLMSQKTGRYFTNKAALLKAEGKKAKSATEIFHFLIHSPSSEYGIIRWSGNVPAALGSRELDETNLDYFLSNAVPALALLVSGGRFAQGVEERLKEFFTEEVRGRRATNKLVVLEAETQRHNAQGPSANPRMEFVPLRNAQIQDALFQKYDDRNITKLGSSFRQPRTMIGMDKFSVGDQRFVEQQVYQPERDTFDNCINKFFMPALGINLLTFVSNPTVIRDSELVATTLIEAAKVGVTVPDEVRAVLSKLFAIEMPQLQKTWSTQPLPFTQAILGMKAGPAEAVREQGRQEGDPAPVEDLLAELGVSTSDMANKSAVEMLVKFVESVREDVSADTGGSTAPPLAALPGTGGSE